MDLAQQNDLLLRKQLCEFLRGGFAPVVILLREFHREKAGVILDGLHFSAWVLLGHMHQRQLTLLNFLKNPEENSVVWDDAHWPKNKDNVTQAEWDNAILIFEENLKEMIAAVENPSTSLFKIYPNGKSISWAVMATFHHNSYHIGQLKTIGRQLGVW